MTPATPQFEEPTCQRDGCGHVKAAHLSGCLLCGCEEFLETVAAEEQSPSNVPLTRVMWTLPGHDQQVVDAAFCLILCGPDVETNQLMVGVQAPSEMHAAVLVGHAIAILRKEYGESGVRNALRLSQSTNTESLGTSGAVDWQKKPDDPSPPRGGGRIPGL